MVAPRHPRFSLVIFALFIVILFILITWALPSAAQQTAMDNEPDRALGGPEGVTQKLKKAAEQPSTFSTPGWAQPYYDWKKRLKDEYVFETSYKFQLWRSFSLIPDVQLLLDPAKNPTESRVWVIGLRAILSI